MDTQKVIEVGTLPNGYTYRPAEREDAEAIYALYVASDLADQTTFAGSLDEVLSDFESPDVDPQTGSLLVFSPSGELAGVAWVYLNLEPVKMHRAWLWAAVHPEHRQRGVGSSLLSWQERTSRQMMQDFTDTLPRVIRVNAPGHLPDRKRLFEQFGLKPARYFSRMRRSLNEPISEVALPEEIAIRPFKSEYSEQLREVTNLAFADHWGSDPIPASMWEQNYIKSAGFRPELSFVALTGENVVGGSVNYVFKEDNARSGVLEGWVRSLGVLREQRSQGIASALLAQSMRAFQQEGLQYAGLSVDNDSPTGAQRLYENLGFHTVQDWILMEKVVE